MVSSMVTNSVSGGKLRGERKEIGAWGGVISRPPPLVYEKHSIATQNSPTALALLINNKDPICIKSFLLTRREMRCFPLN